MPKTPSVTNKEGIENLCNLSIKLLNMKRNAATKYAHRTVLREAINKSCKQYKGNNNRLNVKYRSLDAQKVIDNNLNDKLISEHIIPISIMLNKIYDEKINDLNKLLKLCKDFSVMCLITETEDATLHKLKLTKLMPNDWDGKDKFARYKKAKIKYRKYS